MGLRLEDKWVWDFWVATHRGRYHIFYLQAPRSLGDPDARHAHATIGHAVSEDLVNWEVQPGAIRPNGNGTWDSMATWTGSIVPANDSWHMFYTGVSLRDAVVSQQIGSAVSQDLMSWAKTPGPLFSADPRWYETYQSHEWYEEAWRDPWVFLGSDGIYHALVTARANHGSPDGRGVVGHAFSSDLERWEVGPPLSDSGEFGHLEVSQMVSLQDRQILVFSCQGSHISERRSSRLGETPSDATYVLQADSPLGPFRLAEARPALPPEFYSGRLVRRINGEWVWMAFRSRDGNDRFVGELSDPIPTNAVFGHP